MAMDRAAEIDHDFFVCLNTDQMAPRVVVERVVHTLDPAQCP